MKKSVSTRKFEKSTHILNIEKLVEDKSKCDIEKAVKCQNPTDELKFVYTFNEQFFSSLVEIINQFIYCCSLT